MNNPTENNSSTTQDKQWYYILYKFLAKEIKEKTFGWSLFIVVLTTMPLWSQVIDSIGNIFIVNISKLDFEIITHNKTLYVFKLFLPFVISLFFFIIISLVFFIIRDRKESRNFILKHYSPSPNSSKKQDQAQKNNFGFNKAFIGKRRDSSSDSPSKKHIYHNILSLAIVCNFIFWFLTVTVTLLHSLLHSDFTPQDIENSHHAYDILMNALILIQCSWFIIMYKPFFYKQESIKFLGSDLTPYSVIRIFSLLANIGASIALMYLAFRFSKFSSFIASEKDIDESQYYGMAVFLIAFFNSYKSSKKFISCLTSKENKEQNDNCKPNKNNYVENSHSLVSLINFSLVFFLILSVVVILKILGSSDGIITILALTLLSLFSLYILGAYKFRKGKWKKANDVYTKISKYINTKVKTKQTNSEFFSIGNIQFVILIEYILLVAIMSPKSPLDIYVILPEALYILLLAASISVLVMFLKFYFYRAKFSILLPLSFILLFSLGASFNEGTKEYVIWIYFCLFLLFCFLLYRGNKAEHNAFDFFTIGQNSKNHGNTIFIIFLSLSLFIFEESLPKPLLYQVNADAHKSENNNDNSNSSGLKEVTEGENNYIVVVSAQGGGIAASAWTSKVLEELRRLSVNNSKKYKGFLKNIKAISAVSGGALGGYYFYSSLGKKNDEIYNDNDKHPIYNIASRNSLKAILWGLSNPALAISKEAALVSRWTQTITIEDENKSEQTFFNGLNGKIKSNLSDLVNVDGSDVYFIANATQEETGKRSLISNYPFKNIPMEECYNRFVSKRISDIEIALKNDNNYMDIKGINSVLHSATFPYLTKNQKILWEYANANDGYHLADGGYVDNYGVSSALDFIKDYYCEYGYRYSKDKPLKVLLIQITTFDNLQSPKINGSFTSYFLGPISTLNNSRNSHKKVNNNMITQLNKNEGVYIETVDFMYNSTKKSTEDNVLPLSWQLLPKHKKSIECRWGEIDSEASNNKKSTEDGCDKIVALEVNQNIKKLGEANPIIKLKEIIDCFRNQNNCNSELIVKAPVVDSKPKTEIEKLLKSIKNDTEQLLKRPPELTISVKTNSDKPNFSSIIQCNSGDYLSSKIFKKGEPKKKIKYGVGYKNYFSDCKDCQGGDFLTNTLNANENQKVKALLEKFNTNTTWHILGLTSSKGDFNYNANLAERRIFLYKSALEKYYGKENKVNIIEHPFGEIMGSMDKNQTEDSRRRVYLIPCQNITAEKSS